MDLSLDETQTSIAETFGDFLSAECPITLVRDCETTGFSPELWGGYAELGAPAMGLPEARGGLGLGLLELGLVAMASGRALAPVPYVESVVVGRLLTALDAKVDWLDALVSGQAVASLVATRPHAVAGAGRLSAGQEVVHFGNVADHVLYPVGHGVALASRADHDVSDRLDDLGGGALAVWSLSGDGVALASGDDALRAYRRAEQERKLIAAFWLVGLARRAVEIGSEYALEREQFGTPIGAFQGIAHPLADAATRVDGAELLAFEAAWAETEEHARFEGLCSMAFAWASQTATIATNVSVHTHGGYGVSLEYDIQLYYRRARSFSQVAGSAREELQSVAYGCFGDDAAGWGG